MSSRPTSPGRSTRSSSRRRRPGRPRPDRPGRPHGTPPPGPPRIRDGTRKIRSGSPTPRSGPPDPALPFPPARLPPGPPSGALRGAPRRRGRPRRRPRPQGKAFPNRLLHSYRLRLSSIPAVTDGSSDVPCPSIDPLQGHLRRQKTQTYEMTFGDVERIIAALLPKSAQRPEWWANETSPDTRHVQCRAWLDALGLQRLPGQGRRKGALRAALSSTMARGVGGSGSSSPDRTPDYRTPSGGVAPSSPQKTMAAR